MASAPVVNASPLILLGRGGLLGLLRVACDRVVVPRAVVDELQLRGNSDPAVAAMSGVEWLEVVDNPPIPASILAWDLGAGESAVLAYAFARPGTEIICDDLAARRCAVTLGIPVRGTLGLVLVAKQRGVIAAARPVMEQLRAAGMYLSGSIVDEALKKVGE
ncbi:MAG: DUF3368 domain-containing protein [Planctomycetota bacterium]